MAVKSCKSLNDICDDFRKAGKEVPAGLAQLAEAERQAREHQMALAEAKRRGLLVVHPESMRRN